MKNVAVYNTNRIDGKKIVEVFTSLCFINRGLMGNAINCWYFIKDGKISVERTEDNLPRDIIKYRNADIFFLAYEPKKFTKINSHGYKVGDYVKLKSPNMGTSTSKKLTIAGFTDNGTGCNILVRGMNNGHDGCGHTAYNENGEIVNLNRTYIYYWVDKTEITPFYKEEKLYGAFTYDKPSNESTKNTNEKTFILTQTTLVTVNQDE